MKKFTSNGLVYTPGMFYGIERMWRTGDRCEALRLASAGWGDMMTLNEFNMLVAGKYRVLEEEGAVVFDVE